MMCNYDKNNKYTTVCRGAHKHTVCTSSERSDCWPIVGCTIVYVYLIMLLHDIFLGRFFFRRRRSRVFNFLFLIFQLFVLRLRVGCESLFVPLQMFCVLDLFFFRYNFPCWKLKTKRKKYVGTVTTVGHFVIVDDLSFFVQFFSSQIRQN